MILRSIAFFAIVFLGFAFEGYAQSTREPEKQEGFKSNIQTVKKKKRSKKQSYSYKMDNAINEYEALMKENAKRYAKMEKGMKKPQYSDPTYFGHKRKPKKRPLGKRKMCKECGIVH